MPPRRLELVFLSTRLVTNRTKASRHQTLEARYQIASPLVGDPRRGSRSREVAAFVVSSVGRNLSLSYVLPNTCI